MPSTELAFLPAISRVDEADAHLSRFMSELEDFASAAERFVGDAVPLDDALFLDRAGIVFEHRERIADPATIARLLVFADEALEDAERIRETIRENAEGLRLALLRIYRNHVIERIDQEDRFSDA